MTRHEKVTSVLPTSVTAFIFALALATPARAADGPPDAWLTTKAKIAVLTSVGMDGTAIHVDTVNGKVTLYGKVDSRLDKDKAQEAAAAVNGVKEVRNLLQVVPAEQRKAVNASDSAIEDNVKTALKNDLLLQRSSVQVQSVDKRTVLLAGKAESLTAELRAIETAGRVPGVTAVHSEIESPDAKADAETWRKLSAESGSAAQQGKSGITGAMSDAYITAATKTRLFASSDTPAMDINVDTTDGMVTLFGYVPSESSKGKAGLEAQKVSGVKRVVNELQVVPASQRPQVGRRDSELEGTIEKAIAKQDELRDADIKVEVRNGVARLSGTVVSQSDETIATTIARSTDGVRSVESDLQIKAN
jgi:hyperosmotically inducible periplasmic protein